MEKMVFKCANCDEVFNGTQFEAVQNGWRNIEGVWLCPDCADEYGVCHDCGKIVALCDMRIGCDDEQYCEDCFGELFDTCERCGDVFWRDDATEVYTHEGRYSASWCPECVDWYASHCEHCDEYVENDDIRDVDGDNICINCCENSYDYQICGECSEWHHVDNMIYSERREEYLCDCCAAQESAVIHSYHSGVRPLLWLSEAGDDYNRRHQLFVGVELEIDGAGQNDENAEKIVTAGGYDIDEAVVCERDGSLSSGFELISTTATVDYHLSDFNWKDMMDKAIELGYTSHDANTCGLHVHMDRRYFTDMFSNPEEVLSIIVCNNAEWLKVFSRRTRWQYCMFPSSLVRFTADEFKRKDKYGKALSTSDVHCKLGNAVDHMRGHGACMNFCGYATMEIRFNRGTLVWQTFAATLQFIQLLADITKSCNHLEQACEVNLRTFRVLAKRRGYKEFLAYLKRRNIQ